MSTDTTQSTQVLDRTPLLLATDRCDRCGAQAYVQVTKAEFELLFCSHHARDNEHTLTTDGWVVHDERWRLVENKTQGEL